MSNQAPFEIVAAPFEVYIAPVGEAMPAITAEPPGGNWVLIGTSGKKNISEDGVTLKMGETVVDFKPLGSTGARKSFRTDEEVTVSMMLHDIKLSELARALNFNTVTTAANDYTIPIKRGLDVQYMALLVRGENASPYGATYNLQFELPRVRPMGQPELVLKKGEPAGIDISFMVMDDLSAGSDSVEFGIIRTQFQG